MNIDELNEQLEAMQQFAEAVGGLRKSLINQGFSEEAAEALVVHSVLGTAGGRP